MAGGERILWFINWPRTMNLAAPRGNQKANRILLGPVTFDRMSSTPVESHVAAESEQDPVGSRDPLQNQLMIG